LKVSVIIAEIMHNEVPFCQLFGVYFLEFAFG